MQCKMNVKIFIIDANVTLDPKKKVVESLFKPQEMKLHFKIKKI